MLDDSKAVSRVNSVLRSLAKIKKALKDNKYNKVSEVRKDLEKALTLAKKIKLNKECYYSKKN